MGQTASLPPVTRITADWRRVEWFLKVSASRLARDVAMSTGISKLSVWLLASGTPEPREAAK